MERLGEWATQRRRLNRLRGTPAAELTTNHIDSLELLDLVRARTGEPGVIYDIGANVGTWTLLVKSIFPDATVHAFEPLEKHAVKFKQVTSGLSNVHLHSVALGAQRHEAVIHQTDFSDASSLLPLAALGSAQWHIREVGTVGIQVVALDEWIVANGLPQPELIKLDVQGYELEVLRGSPSALGKASAVIAEISFDEMYDGQCLAHDVSIYLDRAGFKLLSMSLSTPLGTRLVQTDALFMRS